MYWSHIEQRNLSSPCGSISSLSQSSLAISACVSKLGIVNTSRFLILATLPRRYPIKSNTLVGAAASPQPSDNASAFMYTSNTTVKGILTDDGERR
jgi:hypothetical protein